MSRLRYYHEAKVVLPKLRGTGNQQMIDEGLAKEYKP